jgi:hypothetical protein
MRIIVTGLIAHHRLLGGVAWDYLNVVLGLARLGHDVFYVEDSGQWPYNLDGGPTGSDWIARDCTPHVEYLAGLMSEYGFGERWAFRFPLTSQWYGLTDIRRAEVIRSADLLINVSGSLEDPGQYRAVRRLAYIDTDPVFTQIELTEGRTVRADLLRGRVAAHDVHWSVGERVMEAGFETGHRWRPMKHPIVLSEWESACEPGTALTTIMNWTSYQPLQFRGATYGQKDAEMIRFLDLPSRLRGKATLEVAMARGPHHVRWETYAGSMPAEIQRLVAVGSVVTPAELLGRAGWRVVDAMLVCADSAKYRRYIQSSRGEWSVAKNGYVRGRAGWFSARSACYLAAGRPVVVQDTGFSSLLPLGEGVLAFETAEEAVAAIEEVQGHYGKHSKAARDVAAEYFDSAKILTRVIEESTAHRELVNQSADDGNGG